MITYSAFCGQTRALLMPKHGRPRLDPGGWSRAFGVFCGRAIRGVRTGKCSKRRIQREQDLCVPAGAADKRHLSCRPERGTLKGVPSSQISKVKPDALHWRLDKTYSAPLLI